MKKEKDKKTTTSKKLVWFLFLNCTAIEIFVGYITLKSFSIVELTSTAPDFTPLVTLIGAVVGETIGYAVYSLKALKENTVNGIVYDLAMKTKLEDVSEDVVESEG